MGPWINIFPNHCHFNSWVVMSTPPGNFSSHLETFLLPTSHSATLLVRTPQSDAIRVRVIIVIVIVIPAWLELRGTKNILCNDVMDSFRYDAMTWLQRGFLPTDRTHNKSISVQHDIVKQWTNHKNKVAFNNNINLCKMPWGFQSLVDKVWSIHPKVTMVNMFFFACQSCNVKSFQELKDSA